VETGRREASAEIFRLHANEKAGQVKNFTHTEAFLIEKN
jgi:hypothetical protein